MSYVWYWPLSRRGNANGKEGAGLDFFSNDYIGNLTREVIQNSLDAKKEDKPVEVEFSLFRTSADKFPGLNDFLFNYVEEWIEIDKKSEKPRIKERQLMEKIRNAFFVSQKNGITWLRISDFETTGLIGVSNPMKKQYPWFAFINGSGQDVKSEGSGGSKGLGKNAIFANSLIQTLFVSTVTTENEKGSIGISKLVSKDVQDDGKGQEDWTQGIGYCVNEDSKIKEMNTPLCDILEIDDSFRRNERTGTDIFVPFFFADDKWESSILGEAILSFLPAIKNNDLKISVSNPDNNFYREITTSNLYSCLIDSLCFCKDSDMEICREIYNTISNPSNSFVYHEDKDDEIDFLVLTMSSNPRNRVYTYRWNTKMRIETFTTQSVLSYTGVMFIKGSLLCDKLKSVEDATHKTWTKNKFRETEYSKEEISDAIDLVKNFAKEKLEEIENHNYGKSADFIWASDKGWSSDNESETLDGTKNDDSGLPSDEILFEEIKIPKSMNIKPKKRKEKKTDPDGDAENYIESNGTVNPNGNDNISHPEGTNHGDKGSYHEGDEHEGNENPLGPKTMVKKKVSTIISRMPVIDLENGLFSLIFIPSRSGENGEIKIYRSGSGDDNEEAEILRAFVGENDLVIENNTIKVPYLKRGEKYNISVILKEHKIYIWEVDINANF